MSTIPQAVKKLLNATARNKTTTKMERAILRATLSMKHWRYQITHDYIRRLISNKVLAEMGTGEMSQKYIAEMYGVSSGNISKWRKEALEGIDRVRPRGRHIGLKYTVNRATHVHSEDKVVKTPTKKVAVQKPAKKAPTKKVAPKKPAKKKAKK